MKSKKSDKKHTKKYDDDAVFPGYLPDGSLPKGWEYDDTDDSTITASRVAEAVRLGDKFIPQNEAEQELKDEIAEAPEGAIIDTPQADW